MTVFVANTVAESGSPRVRRWITSVGPKQSRWRCRRCRLTRLLPDKTGHAGRVSARRRERAARRKRGARDAQQTRSSAWVRVDGRRSRDWGETRVPDRAEVRLDRPRVVTISGDVERRLLHLARGQPTRWTLQRFRDRRVDRCGQLWVRVDRAAARSSCRRRGVVRARGRTAVPDRRRGTRSRSSWRRREPRTRMATRRPGFALGTCL
jgi:hypothetical protein